MKAMIIENLPSLVVDAGIATIRLSRPAQRNSLRDADLHWLLHTFATLDADPSIRVVVLNADTQGQKRPVFCAGYDVGGFDSSRHDPRLFEKVPDALEAMRPITLCALNGSVYGGATDIVLACDLRVALAGSEFRMPANALGLHYYPSGLRRYVSRLGISGAKRAFLTAKALPVEQLQAYGLFEQVVAADSFETVVESLAQQVASLAPLSVQATKRSIDEIGRGEFNEDRLRERETLTLRSADFAEGRAAFAAKRAPRFTGN
ncbi:enoyl-CoA hydratase/isomerase family protein [Variovorax sp. V213]